MANLEQEAGNLLRQKGLTLGIVESATGGLISHLITNVPGSSDYYKGSVTASSNEAKIKVVGVKEATINKYGAVSHQVAEEMARGGRKILAADICLADTGIAGPGGAVLHRTITPVRNLQPETPFSRKPGTKQARGGRGNPGLVKRIPDKPEITGE